MNEFIGNALPSKHGKDNTHQLQSNPLNLPKPA